MHHLARLSRRLMAGSFGLGLALFLGGQVAFAAPPPGGMNTITINQSITQNAPSTATASAVNNGRGSAFAFANASPRQFASQQSVVSVSTRSFGMRPHMWEPSGFWWWR